MLKLLTTLANYEQTIMFCVLAALGRKPKLIKDISKKEILEIQERAKEYGIKMSDPVRIEFDKLRAALAAKDAEIERLKAEVETLAWNLGGISTLACGRKLVEFDSSMARPALHDVAALVTDYSALAVAPEQKPETCVWSEQSTSCNAEPSHSLIWFAAELTFCPFCGKRIEVKE